jgi:hypothetical protein
MNVGISKFNDAIRGCLIKVLFATIQLVRPAFDITVWRVGGGRWVPKLVRD